MDDLEREKRAALQREGQFTLRKAVSRVFNACLGVLGLKRSGYRIERANRR
jgi:hypothetical protein